MEINISTENKDIKVSITVESKTDKQTERMNYIADKLVNLASELCGTKEEDEVLYG